MQLYATQRVRGFADMPEDWRGGSMRLPGMQRLIPLYTRWCIAVDKDLTRVFYSRPRRIKSSLGRAFEQLKYKFAIEWLNNFNFSDQDYDAMRSCRWQYPEYLSATDAHCVAERRLIAEHARGIKRTIEVKEVTTAEAQVVEGHELLGARVAEDYGQMAKVAVAESRGENGGQ